MRYIRYVFVFIVGFLSCILLNSMTLNSGLEFPLGNIAFNSIQQESPHNRISENDIIIKEDKLIIRVSNTSISRYSDSGSMLPLLDKGANGIRIKPKRPSDIHKGDIVSFRRNNILIVHRVIEKSFDKEGIYFITSGDNNFYNDGKVRFEEIEYITIGILY